jgi:fructose-specific phosphotransferase system IIA component
MIDATTIDLAMDASSKEEAVDKLCELLYQTGKLNSKAGFVTDVLEREKTESTNMGIGVAVPHGKTNNVKTPSIAITRLKKEITWDECEKVKVLILLAVPDEHKGTEHLEVIAKIASLLLEESFIHDLMIVTKGEELVNSIVKHLEEV